ncbi:MAG: class I SAM-dependent methyltransferase [Propionivibrio sp.]|nr:class I SAM-dependent methyltransferase [Propionivibrio sp.]
MSVKHDVLTDDDVRTTPLFPILRRHLETMRSRNFQGAVLDWGCGRGRSVLFLRDIGFDAYGVDVDQNVLDRAEAALARRGLEDVGVLRHFDSCWSFPVEHFQLIFSEETVEHVVDLDEMARMCFRLTAPGGWGIHSFPGSRQIIEPHVRIPLVHWLPHTMGWLRRRLLYWSLRCGWGPREPWPEVAMLRDIGTKAAVYERYLEEKTAYRDIRKIVEIFSGVGFSTSYELNDSPPPWANVIPRVLLQNCFPSGNLILILRKP